VERKFLLGDQAIAVGRVPGREFVHPFSSYSAVGVNLSFCFGVRGGVFWNDGAVASPALLNARAGLRAFPGIIGGGNGGEGEWEEEGRRQQGRCKGGGHNDAGRHPSRRWRQTRLRRTGDEDKQVPGGAVHNASKYCYVCLFVLVHGHKCKVLYLGCSKYYLCSKY
jgi:hypothetical protein